MLPHCGLDNYNLKEFKSEFMKTLYVSDMDGTLLGTDSRVSCETAEIVSGLSRCGTERHRIRAWIIKICKNGRTDRRENPALSVISPMQ